MKLCRPRSVLAVEFSRLVLARLGLPRREVTDDPFARVQHPPKAAIDEDPSHHVRANVPRFLEQLLLAPGEGCRPLSALAEGVL